MPAGRPTDYTPELVEKAKYYLDHYEEAGDAIPSVVGLAKYVEKTRTCLYRWAEQEDKKEFSVILELINDRQQQVLINKGLNSEFNSNITKLVLGKHGYHERQERTGADGKPLVPDSIKVVYD